MNEKVYVIAVDGFVPGLPARVTMSEAIVMGAGQILIAAIENGNYVEERLDLTPGPFPKGKGSYKNAKGVDNGQ